MTRQASKQKRARRARANSPHCVLTRRHYSNDYTQLWQLSDSSTTSTTHYKFMAVNMCINLNINANTFSTILISLTIHRFLIYIWYKTICAHRLVIQVHALSIGSPGTSTLCADSAQPKYLCATVDLNTLWSITCNCVFKQLLYAILK